MGVEVWRSYETGLSIYPSYFGISIAAKVSSDLSHCPRPAPPPPIAVSAPCNCNCSERQQAERAVILSPVGGWQSHVSMKARAILSAASFSPSLTPRIRHWARSLHPSCATPNTRCRGYSRYLSVQKMDTNANYNLAQDASELFDVYPAPPSTSHHNAIVSPGWGKEYYPHPKATGKVKERGQVHKDGDWHRSVQAWIVQPELQSNTARVLLQRRSPYKDTHPNQLDVSCAGHVNAGDDILDTMMRELEEELGGNGKIQKMYSTEDVKKARAFTVASAVEGETEKYGKFICREYQEVFILLWKGKMETNMFAASRCGGSVGLRDPGWRRID